MIDITATTSVNNVRRPGSKAINWVGGGVYTLTLDPEAVTTIEPHRGYVDADAREAPVEGFFTVTLSPGQQYTVDAHARDQIVAAKNAA
ncbi:hypothetical protein [Methylobacterium sp. WL6]|uniref:hypothetical protein n=1 Tax=Methylobacterium sp. WL6 TaxID=2603901 RepID=UPI00164F1A71|nr:hypothetical protein [Methylobacterium sp. WL6]